MENQAKELLAQQRAKHTDANAAGLGGQTVVQSEDQLVSQPGGMPFENVSIDSNMAGNGADPLALKDGGGIINEGAQGDIINVSGADASIPSTGVTYKQGSQIPDDIFATKPLYSPSASKWFSGGGEITIENGAWKYTNQ